MKLEMKGRGIPKELKVGPVGYNDRKDPLRENAQKMLRGEKVSKPFSPESASSPGNSKLTRGYKSGGHVKMGHRIPTDMHIPREIDGHMPKSTPQTRVKKMGGVMQGDRGPGPSKREAEVAVQGEKGPKLKKGGDCYASGGHVEHKALGGIISRKKLGQGAKMAYKAAKPTLKTVGREAVRMGVGTLADAAGTAASTALGPVGGHLAKRAIDKGASKVEGYTIKKAGLQNKHPEKSMVSAGTARKGLEAANHRMTAKKGGKVDCKKIGGEMERMRAGVKKKR